MGRATNKIDPHIVGSYVLALNKLAVDFLFLRAYSHTIRAHLYFPRFRLTHYLHPQCCLLPASGVPLSFIAPVECH